MTKITIPIDDSVQLTDMPGEEDDYYTADNDEAQIIPNSRPEAAISNEIDAVVTGSNSARRKQIRNYVAVAVLTFINLLNYMDRFTIAGVLLQIEDYYTIDNGMSGLLQTSFIGSYMVLSPVFGYLGDRYNRKLIMMIGIFIWSSITLAGSFIPKDHFWAFLLLRGLVGIGEASYSTIAPTIVADLFAKDMRTKMLSIFYFAIPVGGGLGYIVGSEVAKWTGQWQWALRVTPFLGVVCLILIMILVKEPARGAAEGGTHLSNTSWLTDVKYLMKNKSFMLSSFGVTSVAFGTGALAFWAPNFIIYSLKVQNVDYKSMPVGPQMIFGLLTCIAGIVGVVGGAELARRLRPYCKTADPLVCGIGLLVSSPLLYLALITSRYSTPLTWFLVFVAELSLSLQWAVVADILLYVVIPTRRSTAEAFQIFLSHALGDAGSPYLIGLISDSIISSNYDGVHDSFSEYMSLQYGLYVTAFISAIGGGCFLFSELFILEDRSKVEKAVKAGWESRVFGTISDFPDTQAHDDDYSSSDDDLINPAGDILAEVNASASKRMLSTAPVIT